MFGCWWRWLLMMVGRDRDYCSGSQSLISQSPEAYITAPSVSKPTSLPTIHQPDPSGFRVPSTIFVTTLLVLINKPLLQPTYDPLTISYAYSCAVMITNNPFTL